jgi:hypothetical protein
MVQVMVDRTNDDVIQGLDALHARISSSQLSMFELITEADRQEAWQESGARDLAHFLSMRYGISCWKAFRWVHAAHALQRLPRLSEALGSGLLGIDKVVELARFATAETESDLVSWAGGVSVGCVRRKADVIVRQAIEDVRDAQASRFLSWWYFDDGRRFGLEAELPAAEGAAVARALEHLADDLPVMPGEEDVCHVDARRDDALVVLASTSLAADPDPDRASVVVLAPLEALVSGETGCELEGGGLIHAETARRLLCSGRVQAVIENGRGHPIGVGRMAREPSAWMLRQLRYRDSECRFPGCGARRFTQAHHIVWWERGGRTDLDNLLLLCTFHHRLVHEHGWAVSRLEDGTVGWFHPDGSSHEGPPPPAATFEPRPSLSAVGWKP